mgnify:FL=1
MINITLIPLGFLILPYMVIWELIHGRLDIHPGHHTWFGNGLWLFVAALSLAGQIWIGLVLWRFFV